MESVHHSVGCSHVGAPGSAARHDARRRALWIALGANAVFLVLEFGVALAAGSLALLADSVHMVSDVAALTIALIAQRLALRPATARHTYGLVRAEVLAALANAVLLLGASVWIVIEAVHRLQDPGRIAGGAVVAVAAAGFVVNAGSAWVIARVQGRNLNLRAAFWHQAADALGSLGAMVAGLAVLLLDATWVDPLVSLLIVVLIVVSGVGLLLEAIRVLLEAAPAEVDVRAVEEALERVDGVAAVHHTHLWMIGPEAPALSVHVVLDGEPSLHDAQVFAGELKDLLEAEFGIGHATLEVECHDCERAPHRAADRAGGVDTP